MDYIALRTLCQQNEQAFADEIIQWIKTENLWNIWVPLEWGGRGMTLTEGLHLLQSLARTDGSLGWTVTLCSGANFFIGYLHPQIRDAIFSPHAARDACFGGSGRIGGIAEKLKEGFIVSGQWPYATGAPYLSHFTFNAQLAKRGIPLHHPDGRPVFLSFIAPRHLIEVIDDWNAMGMKATQSCSFVINNCFLSDIHTFAYDQPRLYHPIFKIPFQMFSDLTLWVNYIGMAEHFLEEAACYLSAQICAPLRQALHQVNRRLSFHAQQVETAILHTMPLNEKGQPAEALHQDAVESIQQLTAAIIGLYPLLGMKACRLPHPINRIFRDFFTATQHYNFRKENSMTSLTTNVLE